HHALPDEVAISACGRDGTVVDRPIRPRAPDVLARRAVHLQHAPHHASHRPIERAPAAIGATGTPGRGSAALGEQGVEMRAEHTNCEVSRLNACKSMIDHVTLAPYHR